MGKLKFKKQNQFFIEPHFNNIKVILKKKEYSIPIKAILKNGTRIIPYKNDITELKELDKELLLKNVYQVFKFNALTPSTTYVFFKNHLEARASTDLPKANKELFTNGIANPIVFSSSAKFNYAIENIDFKINLDGTLKWLF